MDFQNCYDAAWFGCPVKYIDGQVPDTEAILKTDKTRLYDMPEHLDYDNGSMAGRSSSLIICTSTQETWTLMGEVCCLRMLCWAKAQTGPGLAYKLRGADNVLMDMMTDANFTITTLWAMSLRT